MRRMKNNFVWGSHVEIFAASLYFSKPVFVATCKTNQEYYWAKYHCQLTSEKVLYGTNYQPLPTVIEYSIELCHLNNNHYDCSISIGSNSFSVAPPYIGDSSTSIVI